MARPDKISGADINSICQEVSGDLCSPGHWAWEGRSWQCSHPLGGSLRPWALRSPYTHPLSLPLHPPTLTPQQSGMLAVRENRYIVLAKDFEKAYKTVIKKDEQEHEFYK